ncbi:MAG: hypothetical protein RQM92_12565 [Candidatus Syntrophopropionicum ammoniitolerans]
MIPPGLLEHAEQIQALQQSLDTYRDYQQKIPIAEGEISELQQEALALLRRLKPACTKVAEVEDQRLPQALVEEIKLLRPTIHCWRKNVVTPRLRYNRPGVF